MTNHEPTSLTLVFDLDGTLVDTAPDLTRSLNHVLRHLGRTPIEIAQVRAMVGQGARALIRAGTKATGDLIADGEEMERLYALFLDHYGANICVESALFPGASACLNEFTTAGHALAICTNKPEAMSRRLIETLSLSTLFRANLGGDSLQFKKPDPRHLLETIRLCQGRPERAIMVGDSETDLRAARAAGVPIILVNFGYSETPVEKLGADAVISHFEELPRTIEMLSATHHCLG